MATVPASHIRDPKPVALREEIMRAMKPYVYNRRKTTLYSPGRSTDYLVISRGAETFSDMLANREKFRIAIFSERENTQTWFRFPSNGSAMRVASAYIGRLTRFYKAPMPNEEVASDYDLNRVLDALRNWTEKQSTDQATA